MQEWVKSWGNDGPLTRVGMVAMPADRMEANAAKVQGLTILTKEELTAK
jgi:phosphate transport system substrate-binding protein